MSLLEELEHKVPQLTGKELVEFRDWFERYLEDSLELREEVKVELEQAWQDIGNGVYRTRKTPSA